MNQSKRGPGMSKSKHGTRPPGHMSTRSTLVSSASKKSVGGGMAPSDKSSNIRVPVQVRELAVKICVLATILSVQMQCFIFFVLTDIL